MVVSAHPYCAASLATVTVCLFLSALRQGQRAASSRPGINGTVTVYLSLASVVIQSAGVNGYLVARLLICDIPNTDHVYCPIANGA